MDRLHPIKPLREGMVLSPKMLRYMESTSGDGTFTLPIDEYVHTYIVAETSGGMVCGSPIILIAKFHKLCYGWVVFIDSDHAEVVGEGDDIDKDYFGYMVISSRERTRDGLFVYTALPLHSNVRMKGEYKHCPVDVTIKPVYDKGEASMK